MRVLTLFPALLLVAAAPPELRLRQGAVPVRQAVELTIDPASEAFHGVTDVELTFDGKSDEVWLNAVGLEVASATITSGGASQEARLLAGTDSTVGFAWDDPVASGTLHVAYDGRISTSETQGIFAQREGDDVYVFSQFEAQDARKAFPCVDDPGVKLPWKLTLHVAGGGTAFANTPIESQPDAETFVFAETKPLPSYLVAFAIGPFDVVDGGKHGQNGVPVRILAPKGRGADVAWAAESTGPLITALEGYTGSPYPFEKLDVVSLPLAVGFGAMENAGLITIEQSYAVARPEDDTMARRRDYVDTMAHELAHQWFGNLVTMAWWDDLWLNEAFASWMGTRVTEELYPDWNFAVRRVALQQSAFEADSLESARRIREPIVEPGDIEAAFDGITYAKGQAVLEMYEAWLGPDVFRDGVRRYLAANAWGSATGDDFVAAMEDASGEKLGKGWSTFLDQGGLPAITLRASCEGRPELTISQLRWLPGGDAGRERWRVPVCWRTDAGSDCAVLKRREETIPLDSCPAWIVPNQGQRGYYRVGYDEAQVRALLEGTAADLTVPERIGVVSDADALVSVGALPPGVVLGQVPALVAMGEPHVTGATVGIVASLDQHLVTDDLRPSYEKFVLGTYGPLARELGVAGKDGEAQDLTDLRPGLVGLVALSGRDEALRTEAIALADRWLASRDGVDPEMVPVVLAIAAADGGVPFFEKLRDQALAETDRERRGMLLTAMGGLRDPDALHAALEFAISGKVDVREAVGVFFGALAHPASQEVAWAFTKENLDRIEPLIPGIARGYIVYLGSGFCDEAHAAEVKAFFEPHVGAWVGGKRNLAQVLEGISVCESTTAAQSDGVRDFLGGQN